HFFSQLPPPPSSTLFPYTTLFRSSQAVYFQHRLSPQKLRRGKPVVGCGRSHRLFNPALPEAWLTSDSRLLHPAFYFPPFAFAPGDRKSTRLNSSHGSISYAVFCLK